MTWNMAMIGGGPGSFIGPVHRMAAGLDGAIHLVAGAFSRNPERCREAALALGLDPARSYTDHESLLAGEAGAIDFVTIVTPNDQHAPAAIAALEKGVPVFCEKPLAGTLEAARSIARAAAKAGVPTGIAYTYLGYPMVREARWLVRAGVLGDLQRIAVSYTQGWLSQPVEREGNAQAAWRTDPARSGSSGCLGDIGVHAQGLSDFVSGDPMAAVSAHVRAAVAGRRLDDDAAMLFRTRSGVPGTLVASQVCTGDANRLELSIHGTGGSLRWAQENPNRLEVFTNEAGLRILTPSADGLNDPGARALCRLPGGHPEGFIEALANLYRAFTTSLAEGRGPDSERIDLPGVAEGMRSLAFVDAALSSSADGGAWRAITED